MGYHFFSITDLDAIPLVSSSSDVIPLFHIDSPPTLPDLQECLVREIASEWINVASHLGVEFYLITMIKVSYGINSQFACTDVLGRWLAEEAGTGERERTWQTVLSAVEDAGFGNLAQRLRIMRFHPK